MLRWHAALEEFEPHPCVMAAKRWTRGPGSKHMARAPGHEASLVAPRDRAPRDRDCANYVEHPMQLILDALQLCQYSAAARPLVVFFPFLHLAERDHRLKGDVKRQAAEIERDLCLLHRTRRRTLHAPSDLGERVPCLSLKMPVKGRRALETLGQLGSSSLGGRQGALKLLDRAEHRFEIRHAPAKLISQSGATVTGDDPVSNYFHQDRKIHHDPAICRVGRRRFTCATTRARAPLTPRPLVTADPRVDLVLAVLPRFERRLGWAPQGDTLGIGEATAIRALRAAVRV